MDFLRVSMCLRLFQKLNGQLQILLSPIDGVEAGQVVQDLCRFISRLGPPLHLVDGGLLEVPLVLAIEPQVRTCAATGNRCVRGMTRLSELA